ncbi:hypothetical protein D5S17_20015 [Pseudonocardiaceae bacterium YIM PH 21723]|nr:hypothetical protein D5S17_20015 [Pseudonocardiaceae bacterium YIM PH 21723]
MLHLYASICQQVIERNSAPPVHWPLRRLATSLVAALGYAAAGWLAAWPVLGLDLLGRHLPASMVNLLALVPAGVLVAMASLHLLELLFGSVWKLVAFVRVRRSGWEQRRAALRRRAGSDLESIRFLQTHTTGWSGKLALPAGADLTRNDTRQLAREKLTYPEIIENFRVFLQVIKADHGRGVAVIIGIDELDKLADAEQAYRFINEIKGIFGVPGTIYLVTISQDALASFERRGMPIRDAFDSSFDEIVRVEPLSLRGTLMLLSERAELLEQGFGALIHCMAGGLPREVLRITRMALIVATRIKLNLAATAESLIADDLLHKRHAFTIAVSTATADTNDFVRTLRTWAADPETLRTSFDTLIIRNAGEDRGFAVLRLQAAAYIYHCQTVLEVFKRIEGPDNGESLDLLAEAKQAMAIHPQLAIELINECRRAWNLPVPDEPSAPVAPR